MIALTRRITLAAAAAVALQAAPAAAEDKASFVFTPLMPPDSGGDYLPSLTGVYRDQAIGTYSTQTVAELGFVWSAGNYTSVPAVKGFSALSDSGVAIGNTAGSTTSYTTYDVTTGEVNTVNFSPPAGCEFVIGGINASGTITAAQGIRVSKHRGYKATYQPFEQNVDGSYKWLAAAKINGVASIGLTDDGVVVMGKTGGLGDCTGFVPGIAVQFV